MILENRLRNNVVSATANYNVYGYFPSSPEDDYFKGDSTERLDNNQIDAWLTPGNQGSIDCAGAVYVLLAKGLIDTISEEDYNHFKSLYLDRRAIPLANARIGDIIRFENDKRYNKRGLWGGENTIKIASDKYWGFVGSGKHRRYTEQEWKDELARQYNKGRPKDEKIETVPGYDGGATFINVAKVGMTIFDYRQTKGRR